MFDWDYWEGFYRQPDTLFFSILRDIEDSERLSVFLAFIKAKKLRLILLSRFNAVIKKHQIFEKNHHQKQWFINASIRG